MPGSHRPFNPFVGSRRRVRRIRMRGNWFLLMWLFLAWLAVFLFVVVPYMAKHPPAEHSWFWQTDLRSP